MKDLLVFIGLKAVIEKKGKILILEYSDGGFDLPGGKIKNLENLEQELKREVKEEVGLEIKIKEPFAIWKHPLAKKPIFLIGFKCVWKKGKVILSKEHKSFKWINKKDIVNLPDEWKNPLRRLTVGT